MEWGGQSVALRASERRDFSWLGSGDVNRQPLLVQWVHACQGGFRRIFVSLYRIQLLLRNFMSIDIGTLPTVTVYANPPQGDPFWGTGSSGTSPVMPPPGSPPTNPAQLAYGLMYNGVKVFDQAQLGNPQGVLEEFCKGLSGRPGPFAWGQIRSWGEFTDHMAAHSLDIVGGSQYGLTLEQAMRPNFVAELAGLYQWQANGRLTSADPGRSWYGIRCYQSRRCSTGLTVVARACASRSKVCSFLSHSIEFMVISKPLCN